MLAEWMDAHMMQVSHAESPALWLEDSLSPTLWSWAQRPHTWSVSSWAGSVHSHDRASSPRVGLNSILMLKESPQQQTPLQKVPYLTRAVQVVASMAPWRPCFPSGLASRDR